jgi:hypothetical protein
MESRKRFSRNVQKVNNKLCYKTTLNSTFVSAPTANPKDPSSNLEKVMDVVPFQGSALTSQKNGSDDLPHHGHWIALTIAFQGVQPCEDILNFQNNLYNL